MFPPSLDQRHQYPAMESSQLPPARCKFPVPSQSKGTSPPAGRRPPNLIMADNDRYHPSDTPLHQLVKEHLQISPLSDSGSFDTPRQSQYDAQAVSPLSDTSESSDLWRKSRADPDFNDLYDVTDDESAEEVPLTVSASLKETIDHSVPRKRNRYPSIAIPSPSAWPTIEKFQKSLASSIPPTPPSKIAPSPAVMQMIAARSLQVPSPDRSSTPSLDGSLSSEELDKLSCPGTPNSRSESPTPPGGSGPIQLSPEALQTLNNISETEDVSTPDPVIELDAHEMQEISGGFMRNVAVDIVLTPVDHDSGQDEPLSAISVPSPGGFFSSLEDSARRTWSMAPGEHPPTTSAAENFYDVPWKPGVPLPPPLPSRHPTAEASSPTSSGPSTTRQTTFSQEETIVEEIRQTTTDFEYNEAYQEEIDRDSHANLNRTSFWIKAQENYLSAIRGIESLEGDPPSKSHSRKASKDGSTTTTGSPGRKKSVRFADAPTIKDIPKHIEPDKPDTGTLFLDGFKSAQGQGKPTDALVQGRTRVEAIHTKRRCLPQAHRDRLLGRFEVSDPVRAGHRRPFSHFAADDPSIKNDLIARIQKERQVVEQIQPNIWSMEARKILNGGQLISAPAAKWLARSTNKQIRILDLAGPVDCEWAWQMALDFPTIDVYNVNVDKSTSTVQGPDNYQMVSAPNLWTLPFPSDHFDIISARTLHAMLKLHKPPNQPVIELSSPIDPGSPVPRFDEYDLCLRECHRLLKRGGYLEFSVLDAELICPREYPSSRASALAVEFAFNLRTRGYDSQPTARFMPRLQKAGFNHAKRSWMVLPLPQLDINTATAASAGANKEEPKKPPETTIPVDGSGILLGSTADASCLTGIVGAEAWERWVLKLQTEMGREEQRLLEGVGEAMEEGARMHAGWRFLSGWARKEAPRH